MVRYQQTTALFREIIRKAYPEASAKEAELASFPPSSVAYDPDSRFLMAGHLLWMLEKIGGMEKNQTGKAGRWIGWVIAYMEVMGFVTNTESRQAVRADVQNGDE